MTCRNRRLRKPTDGYADLEEDSSLRRHVPESQLVLQAVEYWQVAVPIPERHARTVRAATLVCVCNPCR
jgi:hypothetical protein